ncbi:MAG: molybdopterin-guanine dinucleotide biosynthesis protein B [Thermodesulfobacteriota bacterium]|nr:molybdopterin-guanine dinucleotide biosynthesis protein B [Thermodesulfobacteriota bacterium]
MIPVVSFVGKSGSGKTTLIEKVIPELIRRSWRVATIKHSHHRFDIDREGKDSWRHRKAGARMTVMSSPEQIAVIENPEKDFEIGELKNRYIHDVDIILTEGFKGNPYPKIEVFRASLNRDMLCSEKDNLIAVASDKRMKVNVPCLNIDDAEGIAQLISDLFLSEPHKER